MASPPPVAPSSPSLTSWSSVLRSSTKQPSTPVPAPRLTSSAPTSVASTEGESATTSPQANQQHLADMFGLQDSLVADFSCALLDKIRYVGRLYVFSAHVAFSSSVFGDTKLVFPFAEVRALNRRKSVLVVPDAIELICGEPSLPLDQCETFVFASFFNRKLAFATLETAWHAALSPSSPQQPSSDATSLSTDDTATSNQTNADALVLSTTATTTTTTTTTAAVVADDSPHLIRQRPHGQSANKRRKPATMPSVLPSLMPQNDDDALPFISAACPHVSINSVDEVFTSESATGSTTIQQELPTCTLAVVWHTLFKTTAFWRHVHSKNGFFDFEGSPWRARTASDSSSGGNTSGSGANASGGSAGGGASATNSASNASNANSGGGELDCKASTCCVERLITFKVSLSQPVGPKSTRMTQTLVARFVTPRRLVIETVSQCHDAPYADSFLVNSMVVVDEQHDGNCLLRIWWGVRFLRTVWMVKGLIESTALRDNQQFYGLWALEALEALHERRAGRVVAPVDTAAETDAVDAPASVAVDDAEIGEREVVTQIQQIVVGDNPPMLARSVVMSLSGVVLLWLLWWGVSALTASGAPPADDPVRLLREQVTRLDERVDELSYALERVVRLLPNEQVAAGEAILSSLEPTNGAARNLLHRANASDDSRAMALLSKVLEHMSRSASSTPTPPSDGWSLSSTFATIIVAVLVSILIAIVTLTTSTSSTSTQDLQKKFETELDAYKDAIRYWHAVLTLQRPTDYGGWLAAVLVVLVFLGTRDWSLGTTFFTCVFVYFAAALGLDFVGPLPFAKFVAGKYENSEADPFVRACAVLALVEHKGRGYWQDMRELRRINNVKFTFQVCFAALIGAFVCSYVSGFTFFALALIAIFAVPPIIVRQLHLQAYKVAKPHIDQLMSKINGLIHKAPAAAPAAAAGAPAAATPTDTKKTN